ncbi:hypothetical protein RclHR1_09480009 [Rhizophagus clarus]|uniref:Uncharacterized protein n=1 Tax=Rhizophagus clarus TaxID=94130 RepID=A0A2Z6SQR6_9GLOM|nr:hypothetical protein RclHR1_09480009 [Rhizophagus clarus]
MSEQNLFVSAFQAEFLLKILAKFHISKVQNTKHTGLDSISKSGTPIRSPELHFEVQNSISRQTINLKLYFEADHCPKLHFEAETFCFSPFFRSGTPFRGRTIQIQNSIQGPKLYFKQTIKSRIPLGADYNISKNSFRGGLLRSGSRSGTRSRLKMDPISRRTRFASFWRLLEEFEVIDFPDIYQTNFED